MKAVSLKDLLEAGCHFGHQTIRWNPKMSQYIYSARDGIHIFDLAKTKEGLEKAASFVKTTASQGGKIVFVGTKRQSQEIIKTAAEKLGMPFLVNRWIGGLLTNWEHVSKRMGRLRDLRKGMQEGLFKDRTKKERLLISREIAKLEKGFEGLVNLEALPAVIFVADAKKDDGAIREAFRRGIKSVAIVDSNSDPDLVDFPIPANDDAAGSIQLIVDCITEAIGEGQKQIKDQSARLQTTCNVGQAKIKTDEKKTKIKKTK